MNQLRTVSGIREIAHALGFGTQLDYDGRILIQKISNNLEQTQPFESLKTMLKNEQILCDILDRWLYEGATYIRIAQPIRSAEFYVPKFTPLVVEPVAKTWQRSEIVNMVEKLHTDLLPMTYVAFTSSPLLPLIRGQEVDIHDLVISKDWNQLTQVLPFEKVKQTLNEWKVPFEVYDHAKDNNRCYIVIKKKYLNN